MKIVYRPFVRTDLIEAVSYYKAINPNLAKQFLARIKEALAAIEKNPLHFSVKYAGKVSTILLKQFPYYIHFYINGADTIVIYAIIHAKKKPADYISR